MVINDPKMAGNNNFKIMAKKQTIWNSDMLTDEHGNSFIL